MTPTRMSGASTRPRTALRTRAPGTPEILSIAASRAPFMSHSRSFGSMSFSKMRWRSSFESQASRNPGPA